MQTKLKNNLLLIYSTVDSMDVAKKLAQQAIGKKLAICVNVFPRGFSVYSWKDQVQSEEEIYMLFKCSLDQEEALEQWLLRNHPYDIPAIIKISASANPEYLASILRLP